MLKYQHGRRAFGLVQARPEYAIADLIPIELLLVLEGSLLHAVENRLEAALPGVVPNFLIVI